MFRVSGTGVAMAKGRHSIQNLRKTAASRTRRRVRRPSRRRASSSSTGSEGMSAFRRECRARFAVGAAFLTIAASCGGASAQTADVQTGDVQAGDTIVMPGLVVSASRTPVEAQRVGSAITVVTAEEIERSRSEEHTSELQALMRISYAVFC